MSAATRVDLNQVVGGYRLDAIIGQGGMGSVYRATHVRLGRKAAVKVLSSALAEDAGYVSRFFHEARIVNAIRHANIIDIIEFVETTEPRVVAYIMELIEGPSLGAILKQRPLSPVQAVNATLQLTRALSAVHAVNVVHRDLKPDNILIVESLESDLSRVPSLKILDFGIAKIQDPDAQHKTNTGVILGTPAYMAPEQVAGEAVSPATDVYAIGEILYEMLSGRRAFTSDGASLMRRKLVGEKIDLTYPEGTPLPEAFDGLIRACLAFDPRERPGTDVLAVRLEELLAGLPREALSSGAKPPLGDVVPPASALARADHPRITTSAQPPASAPSHQELTPVHFGDSSVPLPAPARTPGKLVFPVAAVAVVGLGAALLLWASERAPPPRPAPGVAREPSNQAAPAERAAPIRAPVVEAAPDAGIEALETTPEPRIRPATPPKNRPSEKPTAPAGPLRKNDPGDW